MFTNSVHVNMRNRISHTAPFCVLCSNSLAATASVRTWQLILYTFQM